MLSNREFRIGVAEKLDHGLRTKIPQPRPELKDAENVLVVLVSANYRINASHQCDCGEDVGHALAGKMISSEPGVWVYFKSALAGFVVL
jgi:hypothetical protein